MFQKNFHDDGCSFQIEKQKWQSDDLHESSLCHKNYKVRQTLTRKADFEWKSFSLACRRHSAPTRFYLSYVFTILTMQQLSIVFFRFFNFFIRSHVMENCSSVSFHRKRAFEKNNRLPRILDFTKIRNNPLYLVSSKKLLLREFLFVFSNQHLKLGAGMQKFIFLTCFKLTQQHRHQLCFEIVGQRFVG